MHETTAYSKVFIEINQIGKKLGLPPIGLEHLRKE